LHFTTVKGKSHGEKTLKEGGGNGLPKAKKCARERPRKISTLEKSLEGIVSKGKTIEKKSRQLPPKGRAGGKFGLPEGRMRGGERKFHHNYEPETQGKGFLGGSQKGKDNGQGLREKTVANTFPGGGSRKKSGGLTFTSRKGKHELLRGGIKGLLCLWKREEKKEIDKDNPAKN